MPMDAAFVGRSFPFERAYQVGAEKVREFAAAVGEANPLCRDQAAARAAGYRDIVAPPTFAIAVTAAAQEAVIFDPELGLDFSRVVHGDERFVHHRPIVAGDELRCTVHIDSIRVLAGNDVIGLRTEVTDADGQPVTTAYATLVSRAA
jgi:acyl dehydratase